MVDLAPTPNVENARNISLKERALGLILPVPALGLVGDVLLTAVTMEEPMPITQEIIRSLS
ncbi:MAG: hypothetical protein ACI9T8_000560 [Candidatus Saccharimonadales bacterium]|jgi:hypothetical protein